GPKTQPPPISSAAKSAAGGSGSVILERYQLGRLLGRGSFAKVYSGRSLESIHEAVAVKVIDKAGGNGAAAVEPRILREVSAMRRLQHHPNILKLHEVLATKSKIYLVMELAEGGEISGKIGRNRRFSEPTARNYFQQVVSALRFCHRNGIAHRDIKPQNLLLDRSGLLKVTDFGLSALPEQNLNGILRTACGTPAYAAPEVVYRKGYDGKKADAWSCGVLLYVFLVGKLPFDDTNLPEMYRRIHRRSIDFPDFVSKPAKFLIYRLLDPNPETRLTLDDLIKSPWFKKSISLTNLSSHDHSLRDDEIGEPKTPTAFHIISMSSGLNLSSLLEIDSSHRKEIRFTSNLTTMGEIKEKLMEVGAELGYAVMENEKKSGGGGVALAVDIWEMGSENWFVELKVVDGEADEFGDSQWEEVKGKLDSIVVSWLN
ncbi:hypothetical protein M569_04175, partial [Genlisea aurea]